MLVRQRPWLPDPPVSATLAEMTPTEPRLRTALDAAMNQITATVGSVADELSETLGQATPSGARGGEREALGAAQLELRRNLAKFRTTFTDELRSQVSQATAPRSDHGRTLAATDWRSLSLVDDSEVEERMHSDRIAQAISHACEVELRELAGYMASLLLARRTDPDRHPLGPEALGNVLYTAIGAVSDDAETRKLLARELGQAVAKAMPECYAQIIAGLQARGIEPSVLGVRSVEGPGNQLPGVNSGYASLSSTRGAPTDLDTPTFTGGGPGTGAGSRSVHGGGSSYGAPTTSSGMRAAGTRGAASSLADAQLMALLRRLNAAASGPGGFDPRPWTSSGRGNFSASVQGGSAGPAGFGGGGDGGSTGLVGGAGATGFGGGGTAFSGGGGFGGGGSGTAGHAGAGFGGGGDAPGAASGGLAAASGAGSDPAGGPLTGLMAVNLIRAHREELMQASTGRLDHMVIDVVGSLFDQILSDSRVPPHMARQIARLQLPVLRVALNDSTFFSSRRHPVRRFVNRIASLACAFDDFEDDPGREFLGRVRTLVQEIVDGDFDQIDLYTTKLEALESFIAEQGLRDAPQQEAANTLHTKELELRLQQRYTLQLQRALTSLTLPAYLRDFLPQVWGQALVLASTRDGPASDRAQRYRRVGRDLVMSVQPKGAPALRKNFLMQLPALMKDLNEGLKLIGWPEAAQREFFGKLLPAHAESLKGQPLSELDHNMLVKQLEAVFRIPVPGTESLSAADEVPEVDAETMTRRFSPEEAARVGLVDESAVDWSGTVDIDLGADAPADSSSGPDSLAEPEEAAAAGLGLGLGLALDLNLDLATPEPPEPTRGPQLMDHINLGFAYQMHLKDEWQKVRLAHVSAGRSFFVFTRGRKHQETISMTARMLARMCETGRLRAVESAYLMERATLRARKQLAALKAPATQH